MYAYKNYCYSTIDEVGTAILSEFVFPDGWSPLGYSVASGGDALIFNAGTATERVFNVPSCEVAGHLSSFTGLTVDDAVELAWLCAAVIIVGWSVKVLRRAI